MTIHRTDCVNAENGEEDRRIEVAWAATGSDTFCVALTVVAYDHVNLLVEVASNISAMNIPIKANSSQVDEKTNIATLRFVIEVKTREQMERAVRQLRRKPDIIDVYRTQG